METFVGVILAYVAVLLFLVGAVYRVTMWIRTPNKLNWRLYPFPHGMIEETQFIIEEWMSFKTLFRHNRRLWLGSYGFHVAIVALVVWLILFMLGIYVPWLVKIGGYVMLGSCVYLLLVRIFIPQMRALSTFVEYFNLALFILIAITGLSITGGGLGEQARAYFLGLVSFSPISPPPNATFLLNLFLLEFFLVYFPFSKMFHVASKYFAFHKLRWTNPYEQTQKAH